MIGATSYSDGSFATATTNATASVADKVKVLQQAAAAKVKLGGLNIQGRGGKLPIQAKRFQLHAAQQ